MALELAIRGDRPLAPGQVAFTSGVWESDATLRIIGREAVDAANLADICSSINESMSALQWRSVVIHGGRLATLLADRRARLADRTAGEPLVETLTEDVVVLSGKTTRKEM